MGDHCRAKQDAREWAARSFARRAAPKLARACHLLHAASSGARPLSAAAVPSRVWTKDGALPHDKTSRDTSRTPPSRERCTASPPAVRRRPGAASYPDRKIRTFQAGRLIRAACAATRWGPLRRRPHYEKDKNRL